jgi:hypothetical protein
MERVYRVPTAGQTTPEDVPVPPPASTPKPTPPQTSTAEKSPPDEGGDEEPARSEVMLTASKSGVKPQEVGVAPFISVRVTLVSRDRSPHTLVLAGKTLKVGGTRRSAFVVLPGLKPQRSVSGVFDGHTHVRIFGSAEPGP